jgi:protein SCO1/2
LRQGLIVRTLAIVLGLAVLIAAGLTYYHSTSQPAFVRIEAPEAASTENALPKMFVVPDFSLTDRTGQTVTLADLKGKVWLADLIYTTCPGPCPMLSGHFSELQQMLGNDPEARLVSISSDPEIDTPAVLETYAKHYGASERWLFLTGPKAAVQDLVNKGLKLGMAEDPAAKERIIHSTKFALVDKQGTVRGFYDGTTPNLIRISADMRRLEAEPE